MSPTFDLTCVPGLSNELDGDPDRLDQMVSIFRTNVDVMLRSVENLERLRLGSGEMKSEAFSAVSKKAYDVESGVRSAAYYYQQIANAVSGFSPVLREAQRKAPEWIAQVHQANGRKAQAEADYERARQYSRNVDPTVQQQGIDLATQASTRRGNAHAALNDARGALRAAASTVRTANDEAASRVSAAADNAGLKDSVWDYLAKIGKVMADIAVAIGKWVWENIDAILIVLTIVSLFIPGGPAVMAAIKAVITVAKVISAIKFVVETAQEGWTVVEAVRDGDLGKAGGIALSMGVSLGLRYATKKIGRKVGRSAGKALYSIDKSGKLTSTATGRAIHKGLSKISPVIANPDGSLPKDPLARAQHRTTQVLTKVVEWGTKKGIKKVITQPIVDDIKGGPESAPPQSQQSGSSTHGYSGGGGGGGRGW